MGYEKLPRWIKKALEYEGLKEDTRPNVDNETIGLFGDLIGVGKWDDDNSWCAVFAYAVLVMCGVDISEVPVKNRALAQSGRRYGTELAGPVPGCIGVMPRPPHNWTGHIVFVLEVFEDKGVVRTISGNVSNQVKVIDYRIDTFFKDGWRWPTGEPITSVPPSKLTVQKKYKLGDRRVEYVPGKPMMRGDDIVEWQKILREFGYPVEVDGVYGPGTRDATMKRQDKAGVDADGILDKGTIGATIEDLKERKSKAKEAKDKRSGTTETAIGGAIGGATIGVATGVGDEATSTPFWESSGMWIVAVIVGVLIIGVVIATIWWRNRSSNDEPGSDQKREIKRSEHIGSAIRNLEDLSDA